MKWQPVLFISISAGTLCLRKESLLLRGRGREEFWLSIVCELMIYLEIKVRKWKKH